MKKKGKKNDFLQVEAVATTPDDHFPLASSLRIVLINSGVSFFFEA